MQDNIEKIIANALTVDKDILKDKIKTIFKQIINALKDNEETIKQANKIDKKNDNGFIMDFSVNDNIFSYLEKEKLYFGDVTLSIKDEEKNIIYGTQIMDRGNVVVITDGNPYTLIEMAIRNIMAGNTTIISNNGYMYGTNQLIVQIIQTVLEANNISKNIIQICTSENFEELLSNYANIDLVICIGNHSLQRLVLNKTKNETIISGYENFDLYVEESQNLDFINEIIKTGVNLQLYINHEAELDHSEAMIVNDIDEAIAQINYNGSKYSAAIFTSNMENASKFLKEVKAKTVTVNTSPTINRIIDIKQTDLINEKTIIYPFSYKIKERIEIKKDSD